MHIYCLIDNLGMAYIGESSSRSEFSQHFENENRSLVRHDYNYNKSLSTMMSASQFKKNILNQSLIKSFEFDDMNNSLSIKGSRDTSIIYNGYEMRGDLDSFKFDEDISDWQLEQIGISTTRYIGMKLRNKRNAVSSFFQSKLNNLISLPFLFEVIKKFKYKEREIKLKTKTLKTCGFNDKKIDQIIHETITHITW